MGILFLLLIIPLFSIGIVLYFVTLYDLATTGNLNELLLLISTLTTVITSYFIPKLFVNLIAAKTAKSLNNTNKILILSNYISIVLLLFFGIAMLYRGILTLNALFIIVGIGCAAIFSYTTYYYFFNIEKAVFTLQLIIEDKKYKELSFVNKDCTITYYTTEDKYKEDHKYVLEYNKYTNVVKRISGMVLGGGKDEKNNKEEH